MQSTIARPTLHRRSGHAQAGDTIPRYPTLPTERTPERRSLPCRDDDPDLWFAERPEQLERAKARCGECPVRESCLAGALARGEPWGVWGGEIFDRGVVIARKRPRGRPRKVAVA